jgi:beta-galactosidase GanA
MKLIEGDLASQDAGSRIFQKVMDRSWNDMWKQQVGEYDENMIVDQVFSVIMRDITIPDQIAQDTLDNITPRTLDDEIDRS